MENITQIIFLIPLFFIAYIISDIIPYLIVRNAIYKTYIHNGNKIRYDNDIRRLNNKISPLSKYFLNKF